MSSLLGKELTPILKRHQIFSDKGDYVNAIKNINVALKTDSGNAKYLLLKGNALQGIEKWQEAYDVYSLAIKLNPKDPYLYNQRGLLLKKVHETESSILDFSAALELEKIDSIKLTLLINRGAAKIDIRDFQGAYNDFMVALALDTLDIGTLNNLAAVCDDVEKGDQTLSYLFKIIKLDSTFIGAYVNIGFKYQEMGEYQTAIKYFNKVVELEPGEPLAYSNRAYNRYKLGELKDALSDINKSIKIYSTNSYAYRTRALIYLAQNEKGKACSDIEKALSLGFTKMYGEEVEQLKKEKCN